ncbi:MAG: tail fiber domain-containing protein, partial [Salibacteraceae bacterium]
MKKYLLYAASLAVAGVFSWNTAQAQTLFTPSGSVSSGTLGTNGVGVDANPALAPLDVVGSNVLVRPSNTFNPNGKFIGIGESGGVVGPINGCDIYGFRAQRSQTSFINIGVARIPTFITPFPPPPPNDIPIISWGSQIQTSPFTRPIVRNLEFRYDNSNTTCGNLVARMSGVGFRLTVFGSALASGGSFVNSDARFKQNIQPIGNAMDLISKLEGTTYSMNVAEFPERNFNEGTHFGFIAQNLQEVMPEVVMADEDGYLAVNYDAVVPVLVEGIKEQQVRLEAAETENVELNNQVDEFESGVSQQDSVSKHMQEDLRALQLAMNVEPAANATTSSAVQEDQIQLFQNRPNPFRESTEFHFYLPTTVSNATLVVYSLD